jgi:Porin subfamily
MKLIGFGGQEMKIRKLNAATALGSLTASVALLAGMSGAHAQGAPGAGSYPGSFLVPGTQTSFSVGGYAQLLYAYDFGVCTGALAGSGPGDGGPGFILDSKAVHLGGGAGESFNSSATSGHTSHGCSDFTAGTSRFNIQTRTPTVYGELKTYINVDFQSQATGKTNSSRMAAQLREAYGTLGPFLAGQTVSNFRDASVEAEVIDNGGTTATGPLRLPQVRYTFDFGNGLKLAVAAENAQTKVIDSSPFNYSPGGTGVSSPISGLSDKIPDFTFKLQYDAPWGHVNLRGVAEDLYFHRPGGSTSGGMFSTSTFGWGLGVAGQYNLPWFKDQINGAVQYGDGAGRYIGGSGSPQVDATLNISKNGSSLKTIPAWQVQANYVHYWNDTLRTNIAGSYYKQDNRRSSFNNNASASGNNSTFLSQWKDEWYTAVNLIWSPVPQVDFGIEFARSSGTLESGQSGDQTRINAEATFRF